MLRRKAMAVLQDWMKSSSKKALLIMGARQVGKTYLVREFGHNNYQSFVEINFILNKDAPHLFEDAPSTKDILARLSLVAKQPLIPGKTLIFFDEIQECPEALVAIKGLVDQGDYDYVLSGSLLGAELKNVRSYPVGYLQELIMYPLDFEEFCWAEHIGPQIFETLAHSFSTLSPIDSFIHKRLLELFKNYLVIGGMPDAISTFQQANNLAQVRTVQSAIRDLYRHDISKYCPPALRLKAKEAFDLVPSELSNPNKRFILKHLNEHAKFRSYEDAFIWLPYANVALATYNVAEPCAPLTLAKQRNLFKLFYSDVGLLTSSYLQTTSLETLNNASNINYGSTYENAIAQELTAHGFNLYYYNSKKFGEIDFVVENKNNQVIPLEVKSGKDYTQHRALTKVLNIKEYGLARGYVLGFTNIKREGGVVYLPVYMISQFQNR